MICKIAIHLKHPWPHILASQQMTLMTIQFTIDTKLVSYPTVVVSLMYVMLGTHPNLMYVVSVLGRYASAPKQCHWEVAKHTLHYLNHTCNIALVFKGSDTHLDMDFHSFSDADWCGNSDTSCSTSGFVFISNDHGHILIH